MWKKAFATSQKILLKGQEKTPKDWSSNYFFFHLKFTLMTPHLWSQDVTTRVANNVNKAIKYKFFCYIRLSF
jgi:hypothetical protein